MLKVASEVEILSKEQVKKCWSDSLDAQAGLLCVETKSGFHPMGHISINYLSYIQNTLKHYHNYAK